MEHLLAILGYSAIPALAFLTLWLNHRKHKTAKRSPREETRYEIPEWLKSRKRKLKERRKRQEEAKERRIKDLVKKYSRG